MRTNQPTAQRLRVRQDNVRTVAREKLGVTTDNAIAQAIGIHPSTLSQVLRGRTEPSERFIVAALSTLGGAFEDLFYIEVVSDRPRDAA